MEQEGQALPGDGPESLESVKLGPAGERWGVTKARPSPPADAPPITSFAPSQEGTASKSETVQ